MAVHPLSLTIRHNDCLAISWPWVVVSAVIHRCFHCHPLWIICISSVTSIYYWSSWSRCRLGQIDVMLRLDELPLMKGFLNADCIISSAAFISCSEEQSLLTVRHNDRAGSSLPWVVVSTILCGNLDEIYHKKIVSSGAVKSSRWIPLGINIRLTSVRSYLYKRSPDISQRNPLSIAILSIASFGLSGFCPKHALHCSIYQFGNRKWSHCQAATKSLSQKV